MLLREYFSRKNVSAVMFLAVVWFHLHCDQIDVKTAFINGYIDLRVYMENAEGFYVEKYLYHGCKVCKVLFGLI